MGSEGGKKSVTHPVVPFKDPLEDTQELILEQSSILGETRFVSMDVVETGEGLTVEIDLPGVNITEINVKIEDEWLVVEGTKRESPVLEKRVDFLCMERSFGPFKRMLNIPAAVDHNAVHGSYDHGVLTVSLPTLVERRRQSHEIPIKEMES